MGSVKPSYIKNFAMDLLRTYESSFSPDFEQNKLRVSEYTDIKNKTIRNRIAGYISNVMRQRSRVERSRLMYSGGASAIITPFHEDKSLTRRVEEKQRL